MNGVGTEGIECQRSRGIPTQQAPACPSPVHVCSHLRSKAFLRANRCAKGTPGSRLALGTGHCTRQTGSVVVPPDRLSLHTSHPQSPSTDPEYFCSLLSHIYLVDFSISSQAHTAFSPSLTLPGQPDPAFDLVPLPAFKVQLVHPSRALAQ